MWTIPDTWGLTQPSVDKMVEVIKAMEDEFVREGEKPIGGSGGREYQAQSTLGRPSSGNSGLISSESTTRPGPPPRTPTPTPQVVQPRTETPDEPPLLGT